VFFQEDSMKYYFNCTETRKIIGANKMIYPVPNHHPTRILDSHDFVYILEGSWSMGIELPNGEKQEMKVHPDTVVILPAWIRHFGIEKSTPDTQTLFFLASFKNGDGLVPSESPALQLDDLCIDVSGKPNAKLYFQKLLLAHLHKNDIQAFSWFLLLLCELQAAAAVMDPQTDFANKIKLIVDQHIEQGISNDDIAQKLGCNIKTAEKHFKRCFHTTIHQYLIEERIKKAGMYLEYFPEKTLREIADELHFSDEYHLSSQFKQKFGCSPLQYKKEKCFSSK